jgi:hypothetical protein
MLLSLADLVPEMASGAVEEAHATIREAVEAMYDARNGGVWSSLYPNGSRVPVRTVADFAYIGQAMGTLFATTDLSRGERSADIPASVWQGMSEFAWSELWVPDSHWVVSLSPKDAVNTPTNLLIRRADWGTGGSYGGIPGMVGESLAVADGNYTRATELLSSCSVATHRGSIGQAIAITTPPQFRNLSDNYFWSDGLNTSFSQSRYTIPEPPYQPSWPEFFDGATFNRTAPGHPGYLPTGPTGGMFGSYYWPTTERSIANVGAAFPEAVIRTLFGWQPSWRQPACSGSRASRVRCAARRHGCSRAPKSPACATRSRS